MQSWLQKKFDLPKLLEAELNYLGGNNDFGDWVILQPWLYYVIISRLDFKPSAFRGGTDEEVSWLDPVQSE